MIPQIEEEEKEQPLQKANSIFLYEPAQAMTGKSLFGNLTVDSMNRRNDLGQTIENDEAHAANALVSPRFYRGRNTQKNTVVDEESCEDVSDCKSSSSH